MLLRKHQDRRTFWGSLGGIAAALLLVWGALAAERRGEPGSPSMNSPGPHRRAARAQILVRGEREIEFSAAVNTRGFNRSWTMPGYHAIVHAGGRAADAALLRSEVTDLAILEALEGLGAKSGNNLSMDAWEERKNPRHPAPDTVIAGPPIAVLLRLPGKTELVPLAEILVDSGGRGLDMRLGGNRENIPKWKSGCVVCLFSCPGSKIGNARYTVRDYTRGVTHFRAKTGILPPDGTRVGVVMRTPP